jgi:hypothetical protein
LKRPSFQFYPADWKGNAKLRRCSEAARGVWMDVLCVLHDEDTYGVAIYPLEELCRAAGAAVKLVKELVARGVLKGADAGPVVHIKEIRHAGKVTEITVIDTVGPCWFSSRMVDDEHSRTAKGASTRFTASNQPSGSPNGRQGDGEGERQVDGSTASTSSPSSQKKKKESSLRSDTRSRGTRWPSEAVVSEEWIEEAAKKRDEMGLCAIDMRYEAERFQNYWAAKSGGAAAKVDWKKTWMNWATDKEKTDNGKRSHQGEKRSSTDQHLAGIGLLVGDIRAGRGTGSA